MAITINGSGTITGISAGGLPDGSVVAADLASSLDLTGKTVTLPSGTGGKILQVVSTTKTDTFSYTSQTFGVITGLTVDITPSSSSNKIILLAQVSLSVSGNTASPFVAFGKGGSVLTGATSDAAGNRPRATSAVYPGDLGTTTNPYFTIPLMYVDTAGATSQQTYSVMVRQSNTVTMYVNRSILDRDTANFEPRMTSTITAMEVAA